MELGAYAQRERDHDSQILLLCTDDTRAEAVAGYRKCRGTCCLFVLSTSSLTRSLRSTLSGEPQAGASHENAKFCRELVVILSQCGERDLTPAVVSNP